MMENGKPRKRRQLSPEEKWEIFLEVTSQEISRTRLPRHGSNLSLTQNVRRTVRTAALTRRCESRLLSRRYFVSLPECPLRLDSAHAVAAVTRPVALARSSPG